MNTNVVSVEQVSAPIPSNDSFSYLMNLVHTDDEFSVLKETLRLYLQIKDKK